MRLRQEVINVVLAEMLQDRGLAAVPEQMIQAAATGRLRMPDVIVDLRGLRLAIEGEFDSVHRAEDVAREKAAQRVAQGIAHIGVAVVYPSDVSTRRFAELKRHLGDARLRYAVMTDAPEPAAAGEGTVDALAEALKHGFEQLVQDETLQRAVAVLDGSIERFVEAIIQQPATTERLAEVLGTVGRDEPLGHEQRRAVNRISALMLMNAMIFQDVLAREDRRVRPAHELAEDETPMTSRLVEHWRFILKEVNYHPIFYAAYRLLRTIATSSWMLNALERLAEAARQITGWEAALRHDLMGRVYHLLLAEAKYLGAYYTSIPAAALLAKLALDRRRWDVDWSDPDAVADFAIADLACGSGTLLVAATDAVADNHVRACVEQGVAPQTDELHRRLVEEAIWGFDVLASALHLTASTLSLRVPGTPVNASHLYSLPLGDANDRLGSLEFLESPTVPVVLALSGTELAPEHVANEVPRDQEEVTIDDYDLCIMNPPFTRSVGGNLLFGNLPAKRRSQMQKRLQRLIRRRGLQASITAGLGSVFVALADMRMKPGTRLALVLPRALLSGVAWGKTRKLLQDGYHLEYLVVSHEPGHWNFSENTNLSEVLVVARRRVPREGEEEQVTCVNLWRHPRNSIDSLMIAEQLTANSAPEVGDGQGALELRTGDMKSGEAVSVGQATLSAGLWQFGCAFAQSELVRASFHLLQGSLYLPGANTCGTVSLCRLDALAQLGPDRRDIHDGFSLSDQPTAYPAFWGHDAEDVQTMRQVANRHLSPLPAAKPGRPLRRVRDLWPKASALLVADRLWLKTMRLAAVALDADVLSNVWWPLKLEAQQDGAHKAIALWLNSTPGLLLLLGHRLETRGAWVGFKKPVLGSMPVLDVGALSASQLGAVGAAFDELADTALMSFPEMDHDPTRAAIDAAVAQALDLPDFSVLRELLAREPIISLRPL